MNQQTGRCNVYVCHSNGFSGALRPSHDTAPTGFAEMTAGEVGTLRAMIARYMQRCQERRARPAPYRR